MRILIFGATGSIGQQAIHYLKHTAHKLVGFSYYNNLKLAKNIKAEFYFSPVNKSNVSSYEELILKSKPNLIINAIVGFAGLEITLLAIKHKIDLALANKESMVTAGQFITRMAKRNKINIYPIDSEHTSLMHIIKNNKDSPQKLYITASGGPFYKASSAQLNKVTYQQAIKHPTWKMGGKISIDSATLMNKCFEIIECYWYFKTKEIEVLYHPQSLIHAIVSYRHQTLASIYKPSMMIPIQMVINNFKTQLKTIKPIDLKNNNFILRKIKLTKPIVWGYQVINHPMSSLPIILNAANECYVEQFKNNKIKFSDIVKKINKCLSMMTIKKVNSIKEVYKIDMLTRNLCQTL